MAPARSSSRGRTPTPEPAHEREMPASGLNDMDILYLLIPLSVVLVFLIGAVFWWAVHSGQFEDLERPAHDILMDDDEVPAARAVRR